ncbi:MAG TPA: Crp/Fnr family transcriptional regulator [Alphaproteobacteria bacterium]|nr:Crp/Fnr family transcriptional regulator [Alphaproteobacteria bacterium]
MKPFAEQLGMTSLTQNMVIDRLHYHELFEYFPATVRNQLFNKGVAKSFRSGEYLFHKGDDASFFGATMSGRLRMVSHSEEGRPLLMAMVDAGEIFGETAMLDGLPRSVDAIAETDSSILIIQREDFLPILKQHPDAMLGIIKVLCAKIRTKMHTLELIALQNLPGRLARHLCFLAQKYGVEENGVITVRAGLNQADMGQQLAASRESVNKQLKTFVEKGYISMRGDEITLHNVHALLRVGGAAPAAA